MSSGDTTEFSKDLNSTPLEPGTLYIYESTDLANPIAEDDLSSKLIDLTSDGRLNTALSEIDYNTGFINVAYDGKDAFLNSVIGTGDGATTTFTRTLPGFINTNTLVIKEDLVTSIAKDDGSGNLIDLISPVSKKRKRQEKETKM